MIGIFWLVPTGQKIVLLAHAIPPEAGEEYGDCVTSPLGHYMAREAMRRGRGAPGLLTPDTPATRAVIRTHDYEEWPRGRVVFERPAARFIVYADRQAFAHAETIRARFALPDETRFLNDSHYTRSKLLPGQ